MFPDIAERLGAFVFALALTTLALVFLAITYWARGRDGAVRWALRFLIAAGIVFVALSAATLLHKPFCDARSRHLATLFVRLTAAMVKNDPATVEAVLRNRVFLGPPTFRLEAVHSEVRFKVSCALASLSLNQSAPLAVGFAFGSRDALIAYLRTAEERMSSSDRLDWGGVGEAVIVCERLPLLKEMLRQFPWILEKAKRFPSLGPPAQVRNLLNLAIHHRQDDYVRFVLGYRPDLNQRSFSDHPLLMTDHDVTLWQYSELAHALWQGDSAMVRLLIENCADPSLKVSYVPQAPTAFQIAKDTPSLAKILNEYNRSRCEPAQKRSRCVRQDLTSRNCPEPGSD